MTYAISLTLNEMQTLLDLAKSDIEAQLDKADELDGIPAKECIKLAEDDLSLIESAVNAFRNNEDAYEKMQQIVSKYRREIRMRK